jgi:hypothetical protein
VEKFFEALKRRWVVWVWSHTPNCAEMSRLTSLSFEQPPALALRFKMWLHHLICVWCHRYGKQIRFLRQAAQEHPEELTRAVPERLSSEARERLKQSLRGDRK